MKPDKAPIEEQARKYARQFKGGRNYTTLSKAAEIDFIAGAKSQQHLRDENERLKAENERLRLLADESLTDNEKETLELFLNHLRNNQFSHDKSKSADVKTDPLAQLQSETQRGEKV